MLGYIISNKETINVEEHEIKSFDVLCETDLNIFVVECKKFYSKILYKNNIINKACCYGHVQVLEWFKNSGYKFKYNKSAINHACYFRNVKILEWFKNYGYKLKYDKNAINDAYYIGIVKILEFFKNVKKVIKWSRWPKYLKFNKTIKYKTKNNYIKGYNKN